jgi:hypothetical protein
MPATITSPLGRTTQDLTGKLFGRLTVEKFSHRKIFYRQTVLYWRCSCKCGNSITVTGSALRKGHTKSCGCYNQEVRAKRFTTHGLSRTPIHQLWCAMKERCLNPKTRAWKWYGERGIQVCSRWLSFENFANDMLASYVPGLTLERINNDGNYSPDNCRWATKSEQLLNTRRTKWITVDGVRIRLFEWSHMDGWSLVQISEWLDKQRER